MNKINLAEIKNFIDQCSDKSKVYIGCDSERYLDSAGKWYAAYTMVVVVHINGKNGCRLFGEVVREPDYDRNMEKPALRLMNETYKAVELYQKLFPILQNREIEIHLDINPDEQHGSNCVINQAIGYVRGVCGVEPKVKPDAFAASRAADEYRYRVPVL